MSEVKVNKISPRTGTATTIGDSGDTFTVPSGANLVVAGTLNPSGTITAGSIAGTAIADNAIDSDHYTDGSIDTAHIANDQITAALIADNAIDSDMYVDGSIDLAHMSANSIDSTQYVDGSIDNAHYAAASVTADKTSGVVRPNAKPFLINGGFNVSQRYGETATSFVNNTYGLDRWKNYLNGSCALNYQQLGQASSIVTNLQSTSGINYTNCLYLDCTTAASLGGSDLVSVLQLMEGYVHNPLAGKAMTLSFWVRSSVTGTYCVAFKEGSTKTYVVEYTISSADTWEQKILTLTDDTLANYNTNTSVTTGSSLEVHFTTRLGTTAQQTTADAWNTGNFYGTSNQVTWGTSTSDVFYLSGVQLERGTYTSATLPPFRHESYAVNLKRCQRYYNNYGGDNPRAFTFDGQYAAGSGNGVGDSYIFNVEMRASQTTSSSYTDLTNASSVSVAEDKIGAFIEATSSSSGRIAARFGASGYIRFDAEL